MVNCSCGIYEGIVYAVLSGIACVIWGALIKYLENFNAVELNVYVASLGAALTLPFIIVQERSLPVLDKRTVILWILGGILNVTSTLTRAVSFQLLPLGDAGSIVFSTPIFTALFARVVLKETISWMTIISLVLSLIGMCLTVKLPDIIGSSEYQESLWSFQHLVGCTYGFASVITCAGLFICFRSLKAISSPLNSFMQLLTTFISCACLTPAFGGYHYPACSVSSNLALVGIGISCFFCTVLLNRSLQKEDPTTMSIIYRSTDIILAFVFQVFVFRDQVDAYSASGALIVFACGLLLPLQRWMESQPDGSHWKESFLIR